MRYIYSITLLIFSLSVLSQAEITRITTTSSLSEISSSYIDGQLYFYKNKPFYKSNSQYYDVYRITIDEKRFDKNDEQRIEDLNSSFNDGPVCFNKDDKEVYLTRNSFSKKELRKDKIDINILEILVYSINSDGTFSYKEAFKFNEEGISVGHMAYSETTKRLYYSSNQTNGIGGIDLYFVERLAEGGFSEPKKLGRNINTTSDEAFPYVHKGVLYFSSKKRVKQQSTADNYDIYYLPESDILKGVSPKRFENGINSGEDDFGIVFKDDTTGYFTSARYKNESSINHDIFYFKISEPILEENNKSLLLVMNVPNSVSLDETNFKIIDRNSKKELNKEMGANGILVHNMEVGNYYDILFDESLNLTNTFVVPIEKGDEIDQLLIDTITIYERDVYIAVNELLSSTLNDKNFKVIEKSTSKEVEKDWTEDGILIKDFDRDKEYIVIFDDSLNLKTMELSKVEIINGIIDFSTKNLAIEDNEGGNSEIDQTKGKVISIEDKKVYFALNSSILSKESKVVLDEVILYLKENKTAQIKIWGNTDSRDKDNYNEWLSRKRAKAVYNYLIKNKIDQLRILEIKGFGEKRLVNNCGDGVPCSEAEHAENRRVDIKIVN